MCPELCTTYRGSGGLTRATGKATCRQGCRKAPIGSMCDHTPDHEAATRGTAAECKHFLPTSKCRRWRRSHRDGIPPTDTVRQTPQQKRSAANVACNGIVHRGKRKVEWMTGGVRTYAGQGYSVVLCSQRGLVADSIRGRVDTLLESPR